MNNYLDHKTQDSGTKGECFFLEHFAPSVFGVSLSEIIDERYLHREGDFRLHGKLYEVKDDMRCRSSTRPTENIPIELSHSGHTDGKGWYFHCMENGVDYQGFMLYHSDDEAYPCRAIIAPFSRVQNLVEKHAGEFNLRYAKDPKDGSQMKLLCILFLCPYQESVGR